MLTHDTLWKLIDFFTIEIDWLIFFFVINRVGRRKDNSKKYLFNNISKEDLFIKGYKLSKIPEKLVELTNTLTKGRAKVNLKIDNNKYMDEFNKMINRLSFSLIIAGMIVGSSIIINSNPGPKIHGVYIIGLVGYLVSAILGLWLLISIIMSGSLK